MSQSSLPRGAARAAIAPNRLLGLACGVGVICIWSGFIVISRAGVVGGLSAFDVAALRFATAGLLLAPFARRWWPHHLAPWKVLVLALTGPGALYGMLAYGGLAYAPAAYAGVFTNGTLPLFTALFGWLAWRQRVGRRSLAAMAVVFAGCLLIGLIDATQLGHMVWLGPALFLGAAAVLSVYTLAVQRWALTPRQALVVINLPSAVAFLPLWYLALPSGLADASWQAIALQAAFQGLGPSLLAVVVYSLAIIHLGPTPTAALAAAVPASAAVLAIPVLGEWPTEVQWLGIATVTAGLALLLYQRRKRG